MVGVDGTGKVRAQIKEIADGAAVILINFSASFPPVAAIAINGVAGTGRNEIAVLGENLAGQHQLQIKDLLSGDIVYEKYSATVIKVAGPSGCASASASFHRNGIADDEPVYEEDGLGAFQFASVQEPRIRLAGIHGRRYRRWCEFDTDRKLGKIRGSG